VEQAAYASFESQVYGLTGDALHVEAVRDLFGQTLEQFGMDGILEDRSYVMVGHFFTNPQYIISYVVSNDAALQLYQMEKEQAGAGLACYEQNLSTEHSDFIAFLAAAGLDSPFAYGHIGKVRKTISDALE
jgi:oligoendopeptidase F